MRLKNNLKPSLFEKALRIAVVAHKDMVRKGDGLPYILHPVAVAMKLEKYGFSQYIVAAGLVHDVLEDTDFPVAKFKKELGEKVYKIVLAVTHDDGLEWEQKKKAYIAKVEKGPVGAKAVAIADKIHNLESLCWAYSEQGPKIWKKFNRGREKKLWFESEMLSMVRRVWKHPLVNEYERKLKIFKAL